MGKTRPIKLSLPWLLSILFVIMATAGAALEWGKARRQWAAHLPGTATSIKAEEPQLNSPSATDAAKIAVAPKHKEVLGQPPEEISISFEFPVRRVKISLRKDGEDIKGDPPDFSEDGKTLSLPFPRDAGSGTYMVNYNLCSESEECVDGFFEFTVE